MRTKQLLGLAIGFCVAFLAILSVLHFLEPEFNPPHLISEYQLGRFGWLMSLAFFCLGMASLAFFAAAKQETHTRPGRFGTWGMLIISTAYFCGGIFPPDPKWRRQPAARHRWTDRHLRLAHSVYANEQELGAQRGLGYGRTTAGLDGHFDVVELVVVLRVHHRLPWWRRCRLDKPNPDRDLRPVALGRGL